MDPFAIQIPPQSSPVYEKGGRFWGARKYGYEIDDFFVTPETKRPYLGVSAEPRMLRIAALLLMVVFIVFLGRAAHLQIFLGSHYRGLAEGNRVRLEVIAPTRGRIFDTTGKALVENQPQFNLTVRLSDLPKDSTEYNTALTKLEAAVGEEDVRELLGADPSLLVSVKEDLTHEEAVTFIATFAQTPGIAVQTKTRRQYATARAPSISHLLGYMGKLSEAELVRDEYDVPRDSLVGKSGLEAFYEMTLRGRYGRKHIEVDALGKEKEIIAQELPIHGQNIVLGLDLALQEVAERVLKDHLRAVRKSRGAVVALDPRNGEVRALVSLPTYDGNDFSAGLSQTKFAELSSDPDQPLFPRAIAGTYPPGSTIKPFFAAAALDEGVITPRATILSVGGIQVSQWFFPDWKEGGHGAVDVYGAIADSVNTFFYYIGGGYGTFEGLGPERLAIWARRFGFGAPTNIDILGEASGFVPTRDWKERERGEPWYIGDTYHFAIGQGDILVTPLQVAATTATIANGGTRYEPHLVRALQDETREKAVEVRVVTHDFIDPAALTVVRDAMRQAVTSGSAGRLADLAVPVAGKTGTAQWSNDRDPHAWFTGFGPYRNPELVLTVLVEEGGEGSTVAVPVAKEIFAWYFTQRR